MAEVRLDGLSKRFGAVQALDGVTMTVPDGAFVVLLGPTGAGKTTTLRLIAGLSDADAGSVRIAGREVGAETPAQRDVAMVFQQYSLYPHLTVRENLAFPLRSPLRRFTSEEIERAVTGVATMLRIRHKLDNKATQLSGGEMQRVSIGRALVRRPAIYLMDEPLSSLDAKLRSELRIELKHIQADLGATMLYVTHDQIEAMTMATHVGVLDAGRLVQFGTPREIYEDPDSVHVATRLGQPRINIAPVSLFPGLAGPAGASRSGRRPEQILMRADAPHAVSGRVRRVERLGDQTRLYLTVGEAELVTLTDPHTPVQPGEALPVAPLAPLYFDPEGRRLRGVS
jgi:multiple sugar transport system ATP-binding protein